MSPARRRLIITMATLLLIAVAPVAVMAAGGQFTDDDDSIFETEIEWMATTGVTAGCNPPANDHYCPKANLNREQMAAFLYRFAGFLGAQDGVVSEADHAAAADFATNADTVDGKNAYELLPANYAYDQNNDLHVSTAGTHDVASASVTTKDGTGMLCRIGQTPRSDILVRASGYTNLIGSGEGGWIQLAANGTVINGAQRYIANGNTPFAVEWLYQSGGGNDTFQLQVQEGGGGDDYYILDAMLFVQVMRDTRCTGLIMTLGEPTGGEPTEN